MAWEGSTRNQAWVPRTTRAHVMKRDQHQCQIKYEGCTGNAQVVDHIKPVAQGGTHEPANLQAACEWCNEEKNKIERGTWKRPSTLRPREQHPGLA